MKILIVALAVATATIIINFKKFSQKGIFRKRFLNKLVKQLVKPQPKWDY